MVTKSELVDLSVTLGGVKMRSPIGVGSIGSPLIERERLTAERHAEVLLKHVEAGAGFICLPGTRHIPDGVLNDLRKRAKPFEATGKPTVYRFMRMETEGLGTEEVEGVTLSVLPIFVTIEGDVLNLIDFIYKWTEEYPTGMAKTLEITVPEVLDEEAEGEEAEEEEVEVEEEEPYAIVYLRIYCYEGE